MIKKLSRHGNSLALLIDRSILDLLKIDENTPLEVSTDGTALIVSPVADEKHNTKLAAALESTNRRHGKALRKLAE